MKIFKSRFVSLLMIAALSSQLFSCGYFTHPERRGQKSTAKLDWPVVGLDAIGLIFFIIPGVIAFAVDFTSGTIYLPAHQQSSTNAADLHAGLEIKLKKEDLTKEKIATAIKEKTKVAVNFDDPRLEIYKQ